MPETAKEGTVGGEKIMKYLWIFYLLGAIAFFIIGTFKFLIGGLWFVWIILGLSPFLLYAIILYHDEKKENIKLKK